MRGDKEIPGILQKFTGAIPGAAFIIINQYSDRPKRLQMYDVLLGLITRLLEMFENCRFVELNCPCAFACGNNCRK